MKIKKIQLNSSIILILILLLSVFFRLPFFFEPLDSDEGTYAFFSFFSRGEKFYSSLPVGRLPGIIFIFRFIDSLFPGNIIIFRIIPAILLFLSTFALYKLGKLFFDKRAGLISAFIFALVCASRTLEPRANTEMFMMPFSVFSFYFFWKWVNDKTTILLIFSGFCAAISTLFKQVVVFEFLLIPFVIFYLDIIQKNDKNVIKIKSFLKHCFLFGISFLFPLLLVFGFFFYRGEFNDFWWNSFGSGGSYVQLAWSDGDWFPRLMTSVKVLWKPLWPFWVSSILGLFMLFLDIKKKKLFIPIWISLCFIGIFFNGWFFTHYFVQIIPAFALLSGYFWSSLPNLNKTFSSKNTVNAFLIIILLLFFNFPIRKQLEFEYHLIMWLTNKTDKVTYFQNIGIDTGDASWIPYYQASGYINGNINKDETLFSWATSPLPYYLTRKIPITTYVKNYPLLDYSYMLATSRGWKYNFEENRNNLMETLSNNPPDIILFEVIPSQVFDQMNLAREFSNFVGTNYKFEKKFGNIIIYSLAKSSGNEINAELLKGMPFDLITRYGVITNIIEKGEECEIVYEPIINKDGILRSLGETYSSCPKIVFDKIDVLYFGKDGNDFVGNSFAKPSGDADLHIKLLTLNKPISFIRVKSINQVWSNQQYGVNYALKHFQQGNQLDLYIEPPSELKGRKFEIYIIFEDGTLAKESFLSQ